ERTRADIHDGPEHKPLQSEAGYIDARPQSRQIDETSCDARPDHTSGSCSTVTTHRHRQRLCLQQRKDRCGSSTQWSTRHPFPPLGSSGRWVAELDRRRRVPRVPWGTAVVVPSATPFLCDVYHTLRTGEWCTLIRKLPKGRAETTAANWQ